MTKTLKIEGMSCMHCVGAVTRALSAVTGVSNVKVDLAGKTATLDAADTVSDSALRSAVEDAGFDVV